MIAGPQFEDVDSDDDDDDDHDLNLRTSMMTWVSGPHLVSVVLKVFFLNVFVSVCPKI